jgi:hypothetical protein
VAVSIAVVLEAEAHRRRTFGLPLGERWLGGSFTETAREDSLWRGTEAVKVQGVICPKCSEWIWSRHRHDFRYCRCKAIFVDGGRDYLRYSHTKDDEIPKVEEREIR